MEGNFHINLRLISQHHSLDVNMDRVEFEFFISPISGWSTS